jgi:hypothetical protein
MHGRSISKVALGKALKTLEPKHVRFVKALSEIRNDCVHDVRNVAFRFDECVSGLGQDRRQSLFAAFTELLVDQIQIKEGLLIPRDELVRQSTRVAFWIAATLVLAELYVQKELAIELARAASLAPLLSGLPGLSYVAARGVGKGKGLLGGIADAQTKPEGEKPR